MSRPLLVCVLLCVAIIAGALVWKRRAVTVPSSLGSEATMRVLIIGNSFVTANDLPSLFEPLAEKTLGGDVFVCSVSFNGARFVDHLARLNDASSDALIRRALITWPDAERRWDFVILQEQSQLLGFPRSEPDTEQSFRAAKELAAAARATGAKVVLYGTWGFWPGDETNRNFYPDFLTMNHALQKGTQALADELTTEGVRPRIAPVGAAFEREHARSQTAFRALYTDERHPSLEGSYLAASVLVRALGNRAVSEIEWAPARLEAARARELRRLADDVASVDRPTDDGPTSR